MIEGMEHRIHIQKLISRNEQGYTESIPAAVQIQVTGLTNCTSLLGYKQYHCTCHANCVIPVQSPNLMNLSRLSNPPKTGFN